MIPERNVLRPLASIGLCLCLHGAIAQSFDGYVLYNLNNSTTARLRDDQAAIAHTWSCPTNFSYAMALKPDGNIVRSAETTFQLLANGRFC